MLRNVAGRNHEVWSAVALKLAAREELRLQCSRVGFRVLSRSEVSRYWQSGEPVDKAGAYAIQGFGGTFVRQLEGSYSGVMGLPLFETWELLRSFGLAPE